MKRPWIVPVLLALALAVLGAAVSARSTDRSRATDGGLIVTGAVRVDEIVVEAPSLTYPAPDVTVGVRSGPERPKAKAPSVSAGTARTVAGVVASVPVEAGSRVETGQLLVRFDTAMLDLGYRATRSGLTRSRQDLARIDEALEDLDAKQADLDDARAELASALAEASSARSRLTSQRAKLRRLLAALPKMPPSLPPSMPLPPPPTGPDPRALEAKLTSALARLDAGVAKALAARARLLDAQSKLDGARDSLKAARPVLEALVGVARVEVDVARAEIPRADVRSPASGLLLDVRRVGETAMVGAPVALIRRDGPAEVEVFLSPTEVALVSRDATAEVRVDSRPGEAYPGAVSRFGDEYVFPPTDHPTGGIHPERALPLFITLDGSPGLPAGTWVDVTIGIGERREARSR